MNQVIFAVQRISFRRRRRPLSCGRWHKASQPDDDDDDEEEMLMVSARRRRFHSKCDNDSQYDLLNRRTTIYSDSLRLFWNILSYLRFIPTRSNLVHNSINNKAIDEETKHHLLWFTNTISPSASFRLQEDPPTGVSGAPTDNNIMIWNAVIFGPHDTPFEDGTFKLTIEFTEEYPNKPPTVRFVSKMFHPNVYADGGICLDILQNRWSPTYDVSAILTSIQSLLSDPNPNSPANSMAAQLYKENRREYEKRVKACVEQSFID